MFVGVDVGGTKILGVAADPVTGRVTHREQRPTPIGQDSIIADISAVVEALVGVVDPAAVGIGMPGLVDRRGVLRYGPNVPGVLDLDISEEIRRRFGLPTVADNDAANTALAEHRVGAARGAMHAVIITQGTGIGGALVVDGRVVRGAHGFAGEPGHMLINAEGHRCACGQRGCWEAVASGAGLANLAREVVAEGAAGRVLELAGGIEAHIRGEHVSAALAEGDAGAAEIFDRFAGWVARGLGSLVTLLDPEVIVLGGGLTTVSGHFVGDVQSRLMDSVMGGSHRPEVPVVPAELGDEAGAIGAAINASDIGVGP